MKVTLIAAISMNGKITSSGDAGPQQWASKEDQQFFAGQIEQNNFLVMGRKTYQNAKPFMRLRPNKLRIVMTRNPERYQREVVPGQLEFRQDSPLALVSEMEKQGFQEMLLLGGGEVNTAFLQSGLVNEMLLT